MDNIIKTTGVIALGTIFTVPPVWLNHEVLKRDPNAKLHEPIAIVGSATTNTVAEQVIDYVDVDDKPVEFFVTAKPSPDLKVWRLTAQKPDRGSRKA